MKNFFTSFFATLSALLVFCFGSVVVFFIFVGMLAALGGDKKVTVAPGSYLVVDLNANIQDAPEQMEGFEKFAEVFGGRSNTTLQLRQVTRALEAAAKDSDIRGVLLRGQLSPVGYGTSLASLREVRGALEKFRASGKPVKAYLSFATTREFYLASAASQVTLDPYGGILLPGLASQPMFFAGAFEKFGIGVQVTRVGKYKSAVEPYTRKDMSPENRAQIQKLLDDVWGELVTSIEQSRGLAAGSLQKVVDTEGILRPKAAIEAKLVDREAYWDVVLEELKADTGRKGGKETFKQIGLKEYAKLVPGDGVVARRATEVKIDPSAKGKIAIVYAEGEIADGDGREQGVIYGDKVARQLRELRLDDSIKAVVLRVNSPGGSASASETIQREVRLVREKKPIVVSMGGLAASGGYWISTYGDRIFAEPTTITGSIGVFGMFLNFQGLATDKLGLTFDMVKTGKFADALTVTRPKTPEELAMFQHMVDWIYDEFTRKVAESRKLDIAVVREIAQGRVWSGAEGKKLGLVDEIGGLQDAVKYAAQKANLGEKFRVVELPRKKPFAEALSEALDNRRHEQAVKGPAGLLVQQITTELESLSRFNDPQGIYARLPLNLRLQ
ncbi:MAG: signal peptide peptidase SppA [Candidatus Didemnitutus sp.]|nr:signal peptide peptidase SppA [Candidatus Didemnitutus sp.]